MNNIFGYVFEVSITPKWCLILAPLLIIFGIALLFLGVFFIREGYHMICGALKVM